MSHFERPQAVVRPLSLAQFELGTRESKYRFSSENENAADDTRMLAAPAYNPPKSEIFIYAPPFIQIGDSDVVRHDIVFVLKLRTRRQSSASASAPAATLAWSWASE
jgi:hypothetical protein